MSLAVPATARGFQGERAGVVSRVLAAGIDLIVVVGFVVAAVAVRSLFGYFFSDPIVLRLRWPSPLGLSSLGAVLLFAYLGWGWARTGRTAGKRILGLSRVSAGGGRVPPTIAIGRAALSVMFPLGLLWCAVTPSRRSLQDLLLGTAVVYDWRGSRTRRARS